MDAHDPVADRYRRFAELECGSYAPHYARLAHAVADDDALRGFIAALPDTQPNLFLASVQYLSGPDSVPADGRELAQFVSRHRSEIASLMRARRTQTNEVGRCTSILPALPPGPLALLEVGASAGLCLLLDRFRYDYGGRIVGEPNSGLTLECASLGLGSIPVPAGMPDIVWRGGLDLEPVDPRDPDTARWLLSLIWPDHPERRARLQAALEVAGRQHVAVERGDLIDDLSVALNRAPPDARLVVFHSAVFPYVPNDRRSRFAVLLAEHSRKRDIVWISNEGPGMLPALDDLAPDRGPLRFRVGRTTFSEGKGQAELLALAHPHGGELEWLT